MDVIDNRRGKKAPLGIDRDLLYHILTNGSIVGLELKGPT